MATMMAAPTLIQAAIPGVTIVYGEGDWPSVLARTGPHATRFGPQNDGTDGRVITVGDVSVKIVTMPGHTPGTLSFLFEFKDKGQPISAAYVGGTAISFTRTCRLLRPVHRLGQEVRQGGSGLSAPTRCCRITPSSTTATSRRIRRWPFAPCSATTSGTAISITVLEVAPDKPDSIRTDVPNPYFVGQRRVLNYMGVVELCAMAAKLRATGSL